jgi:hypothetical protein
MRARNIKPAFFENEVLAELDPLVRLLFIGLWCNADRDGRMEFRPKRLKANIMPYDDVPEDTFLSMCRKLHDAEFVTIYKVGGTELLEIPTFSTHQNPHIREKSLKLPIAPRRAQCLHGAGTIQAPDEHQSSPEERGIRNDDSGKRKVESGKMTQDTLYAQSEPCAEKVVKKSKTGKTIMVEYTDRFELFWSAFPQRKQESGTMTRGSKQKAFQEWQKYNLDAKDQNPEAELITKAAKYYKVDKPRDAERWLRDRGWQDGCGKVVQPKPGSWKPKEKAL